MQPAILLTAAEYARLKEQEDKLSNWLGKRTSYHPDELPAGITSISNEAIKDTAHE